MKKFQIFIIAVMLISGIAGVMTMSRAAEVIYVEGNVQVQSPGTTDWKKLEKGMKVEIGDTIRTARRSTTAIALDAEKRNVIRIAQKALAVLNSANPGIIDRVDLSKGKIYSNLENIQAGLSFEVNTPSAVAGVRGSSYSVYVERDEDEVSAIKDTVFLKAYDADKNEISEIMIPEGFKTFVERFEGPSSLIQVSNREFDRFDNIMEDVSANVEGRMAAREAAREAAKQAREAREKAKEEQKSDLEQKAEQTEENKEILDQITDTKSIIEESNADQEIQEFRAIIEHGGH